MTANSKSTPGPYSISPLLRQQDGWACTIHGPLGGAVARLVTWDKDITAANAAMLAAAPTLVVALEELLREWRDLTGGQIAGAVGTALGYSAQRKHDILTARAALRLARCE